MKYEYTAELTIDQVADLVRQYLIEDYELELEHDCRKKMLKAYRLIIREHCNKEEWDEFQQSHRKKAMSKVCKSRK